MERLLVETGFRDLQFKQTLFHHPDEIHEAEKVMCGHGQGGFAVVVGVKKDGNIGNRIEGTNNESNC